MTGEPKWVSLAVVLESHKMLIAEHGGQHGVRDQALLESALASPQNRWTYGETDLFLIAASYAHALTRNHPFLDGNKRIAFLSCFIFLRLNHLDMKATEAEAYTAMMKLTNRDWSESTFAQWLKDNLK